MHRLALLAAAAAAITLAPAHAHREAGAHVHGLGTLNIAVEGNKVTMELEIPAADIVGFEHVAKTKREKQAVEKAKALLEAPLGLFKLPAAADCRLAGAKVEMTAGEDEAKAAAAAKGAAAKKSGAEEDGHSEVRAQYALECQAPVAITAIEFPFFRAFAGAEKLDVNVITAKGQNKFQVSRKRPSLSLAGMI